MTGKEILQEEFEKAGMRGYKAEQVDVYLKQVAAFVDAQEKEKDDLLYKVKILAEKIEEYKGDEENIREALLGAQKLGTSILNEAKSKSEGMVRDAKTIYEDLMGQAKTKVDLMTKESLQKANSELAEIKRDCERERLSFEKMKKEVSNFKSSILKQYKVHLDLLSNLPSVTNASITDAASKQPDVSASPANESTETEVNASHKAYSEVEIGTKDTAGLQAGESFLPDIKPNFESVKPTFFDQDDASNSYVSKQQGKAPRTDEPLEASFPKAQTLPSHILTNENEIEEDEKEQTKEFMSESADSNVLTDKSEVGVNPEEAENDAQEKFPVNMGAATRQRPNYMEKFGELKFGGFGSDK